MCEPLFGKKLPSFDGDIPHKNSSNGLYNEEYVIKKHGFFAALTATEIVGMMKIELKW